MKYLTNFNFYSVKCANDLPFIKLYRPGTVTHANPIGWKYRWMLGISAFGWTFCLTGGRAEDDEVKWVLPDTRNVAQKIMDTGIGPEKFKRIQVCPKCGSGDRTNWLLHHDAEANHYYSECRSCKYKWGYSNNKMDPKDFE